MNNNSVEQPDPDNIKMFVGQVPHDMDENDLRKLFEEYGRVHQINILRDKITGSHRVISGDRIDNVKIGNETGTLVRVTWGGRRGRLRRSGGTIKRSAATVADRTPRLNRWSSNYIAAW
ncbi:unnamed protein product, partial [Heterotrigona itama]